MPSECKCSKLQYEPFSHLRSVFLDRVIHLLETLGDQVNGRSPKKVKSLIEFPNIVHVKVQVLCFNMILISSPWRILTPSYPLGDKIRVRCPRKLNIFIEVP